MADATSPEFLALQRALAGRYSLEREIGRGGMGVVYLARDVALDRPVAIKLLPEAMAAEPELRDRFLREARTAAQLSHPNIVPVHLVEERQGLVYFVMALVDGESLGQRVHREGPLPPPAVVRMLQEVAWALGYAHGRGVVHRDIKPDNILLERASGRALLTDFGIARSLHASASATTPGLILGTLQYIAPEQAGGDSQVDGRADLYSLGVTAFFALTGRLPFDAPGGAQLLAAHMFEPAPPVASIAPSVPPKLAEIVDRALLKEPGLRWQTGEDLADALSELGAVAAMPPSIRMFVTTVVGAVGQIMMLLVALNLAFIMMFDQVGTVAKLFAVVAFMPLLPVVEAARAVAIAGYGFDDVQRAIAADMRGSDAYTMYMARELKRSAEIAQSRTGRAIVGAIGLLTVLALGAILLVKPVVWVWWKVAVKIVISLPILWIGIEALGFAAGIEPFRSRVLRYINPPNDRKKSFMLAAWRSAPVRAILAIGRMLTRAVARRPAAAPANQPTEVLLAAAAEGVFADLAPEHRKAAAGVPALVKRLEYLAAGHRARLAVLEQGIASVGDVSGNQRRAETVADMRLERDRVAERLRSTVEAMENLRLDLLKLRAGIGSEDDLTTAIDAAQQVGEGIAYTLKGQAEASKIT